MNAATRDRVLFGLAILVGAGAWFGVVLWSGRQEAWDAPEFTTLGLPLVYGACLVLGFFGSRQAWRWPVLVFGALSASAVLGSERGFTLWPLTLLFIALMAAVGLIPTYVGVGLRRVFAARRARRAAAVARLKTFAGSSPGPQAPEPPPAPRT